METKKEYAQRLFKCLWDELKNREDNSYNIVFLDADGHIIRPQPEIPTNRYVLRKRKGTKWQWVVKVENGTWKKHVTFNECFTSHFYNDNYKWDEGELEYIITKELCKQLYFTSTELYLEWNTIHTEWNEEL